MVKKCDKVASDLALEFRILQDQIGDSGGTVKKKLEKRRENVISRYKKLLNKCKI